MTIQGTHFTSKEGLLILYTYMWFKQYEKKNCLIQFVAMARYLEDRVEPQCHIGLATNEFTLYIVMFYRFWWEWQYYKSMVRLVEGHVIKQCMYVMQVHNCVHILWILSLICVCTSCDIGMISLLLSLFTHTHTCYRANNDDHTFSFNSFFISWYQVTTHIHWKQKS